MVSAVMVSRRNRTDPSANTQFTPPVWKLYGFRSLLQLTAQVPSPAKLIRQSWLAQLTSATLVASAFVGCGLPLHSSCNVGRFP